MNRIQVLLFVVSNILLQSIHGKQICDLKDAECLTRGAKNVYKSLVTGIKNVIEPIDPIHLDKLVGYVAGLTYEIKDITMSGLRDCEVVLFKCNEEVLTYEYHLQCPKLDHDYIFEIKGAFESVKFDGIGLASLKIDNYLLILKGNYSYFISEKDKKPHMMFNNYNLDSNLKGKMTLDNKSLMKGSKEKFDIMKAYMNDNYKRVEKVYRSHVLEKIMSVFVEEYNTYLRTYPLEEVIARD